MEEVIAKRQKAKEWTAKAIAFYKNSGKEIALAEFAHSNGHFVHEDKYVFVLDMKGTMLAHGINEKYAGMNFMKVKDSTGKEFIRAIIDIAGANGSGWVDYQWYNPLTKELNPKSVYFEKIDDMIICSGVYLDKLSGVISHPPATDLSFFYSV
jgi:cytochrome c